ncbi:MAG: hypothetical protein USCAAHI_01088 [Beijerinckiaceae bacterium]|nr:MAG: hypothetical protein USCAAHI_01088 [Beijerinckiaceae bacterium]
MIRELFRPVGTDVPLGNRWTPAAGTWQLTHFLSLSVLRVKLLLDQGFHSLSSA